MLPYFFSYVSNPERAIYDFSGRFGIVTDTLFSVLETVVTYYVSIFYVILPLMQKKGKGRALVAAFILYVAKMSINYWFYSISQRESRYELNVFSTIVIPDDSIYWFLLWHGIVFYLVDLIISFSVALMVEWIRKSKQQIILEKQKAEAELSVLKHQINPHFLFNSLSFIHSKIFKIDDEAAQSVLILADIMRYALGKNEDASGRVHIMEEVSHVKNVIEINQRRNSHRLNIVYEESIKDQSVFIAPLILITLVENAFKHGDLRDKGHPLVINLHTNERELSFYTRNKKGKGIKELSHGIGLQNIKQQLNLLYGENYTMIEEEGPDTFVVLLKIPLNP